MPCSSFIASTPKQSTSMQEVLASSRRKIDATRTSLDNTHFVLERWEMNLLQLFFRWCFVSPPQIGYSPDRASRHVLEIDQVDDGTASSRHYGAGAGFRLNYTRSFGSCQIFDDACLRRPRLDLRARWDSTSATLGILLAKLAWRQTPQPIGSRTASPFEALQKEQEQPMYSYSKMNPSIFIKELFLRIVRWVSLLVVNGVVGQRMIYFVWMVHRLLCLHVVDGVGT